MKTFLDLLLSFKTRGSKEAVVCFDAGGNRVSTSYVQLYALCVNFSQKLNSLGVKREDKVILYLNDPLYWLVSFFACQILGAVAVPVDPKLNKERFKELALSVQAKLVLSEQKNLQIETLNWHTFENLKLENLTVAGNAEFKPEPRDLAEIIFTSGTTDEPKGVCLSHKNLMANIEQLTSSVFEVTANSRFLAVLPAHSSFQQTAGFFVPLAVGASIVVGRNPGSLGLIETFIKEKITVAVLVPSVLRNIKNYLQSKNLEDKAKEFKNNLGKNFQFFISGGFALEPEILEFYTNLGFDILEGYGLTECSPVLTTSRPGKQMAGSVGQALPGVELKIENGEILAKGENIFNGYYNDEVLTGQVFTKDGWFKTGDMGELNEAGYLRVKGRKEDLEELDESERADLLLLEKCKGVTEACLVYVKEGLCAVIVLNKEIKDAIEHIKKIKFMTINKVFIWTGKEFPKNSLGKIQRFRIKSSLLLGNLPKL